MTRAILALSALILGVGARAAPPPAAPALDAAPALKTPAPWLSSPKVLNISPATKEDPRANCRGHILATRDELGLPKLPDDDAKAGDPLFIAAVDKMIDGCEVLVMRDDTSDIRPLPQFQDGPGKVIPLGGQ
jgi:hypothetical protein